MDEFPSNNGADRSVSRRTVLVGSTLTGLTALGGCLGGDENADAEAPDPITIEAGTSCDNCTMAIVDYPGPVGESFYDDAEELLGDDRPAQFCSSRCTYAFTFDHEDDSEPIATYVTDYSSVDYEIDTGDDASEISSHVEAEHFAPAADLTYVVDSEVEGAMGASMIGFSDSDDATAFQDEHGGDRYEHEDVTQELLMSLM
ncbi:nitrous oxide reductase accessory protein NosL [Natrinema pallidum]|uniref:Lipoprotein NosL n=2 Tax=Natrinema pallidum TaxID=69527 RepID=L9YEH1_9EURY|nr:nitrous oxide reductase accessory protein NosL [Natrinema pallidum]ELY72056.1 lipoprotein NosL [Natrinema pallidum DSM 3751]QCW05131.1 nitrous oxide reductase accessory protein NosL [Natrinema pallidum]